jgi:uncharacterized protein YndB with AHSA1/START domain
MSRLRIQFIVPASPVPVWDFVVDPARIDAWQTYMGRVVATTGDPGAIGSSCTSMQRVAGRDVEYRLVVRESRPPEFLETLATTEGGWSRQRTTIAPEPDGGSTVTAEIAYELSGSVLGSMLGRVSGNVAEREFRRSYARLRDLLEGRPPPAEPASRSA